MLFVQFKSMESEGKKCLAHNKQRIHLSVESLCTKKDVPCVYNPCHLCSYCKLASIGALLCVSQL